MPNTERSKGLLARQIPGSGLPGPPARKFAVLTCMDARIDIDALFGLDLGDAHVIRNAGGLATSDAIRSLAASQRLLGTEEIVVIQHTDCGIHRVAPDDFAALVASETGRETGWEAAATDDPRSTLEVTLETLRNSPELPRRDRIQGWVLDLESGRLIGPADGADA